MGTITIHSENVEKDNNLSKRINFLKKYFKEEHFLEIDIDDMKEVTILSDNPKTEELIGSESFKNDFNSSGFKTMTYYISWAENPFVDCNGKFDGGTGFLPRMKYRDYCDKIKFKTN